MYIKPIEIIGIAEGELVTASAIIQPTAAS